MPELQSKTAARSGKRALTGITNRVRSGLAGKSRQVIAIAALAGVTGAGLAAASFAHPAASTPAQAASALDARSAAALRADRSQRQSATDAAKKAAAKKAAKKAAARKAAARKAAAAAAAKKKAAAKKPAPKWVSPIPGAKITSCYGPRWGVLHAGEDFGAPAGTPEHAVGAGTVFAAGWTYAGYGISVVINHGNGYFTHYAHMSKTAVKVGQRVKAGQVIGYEGSTGDSTGPHLHFEVHKGIMWNQIDPAPWLKARGVITGC